MSTLVARQISMPSDRPEGARPVNQSARAEHSDGTAQRRVAPNRRILVVTHYYPEHKGGVEIVAGTIAEELARRGWQVTWVASDLAPVGKAGTLPAGSSVKRVPMRTWNYTEKAYGIPYPVWGPVSLWKLSRCVRRADLVHLHDCLYFGNIVAFLCAKIYGKPVVFTQHIGLVPYANLILRFLNNLATRLLGWLLLGHSSHCVFCSQKVRDFFSRIVPTKGTYTFIPNGVDMKLFHAVSRREHGRLRSILGWPADRPVVLYVGRFVAKKNLLLLKRLAEHFSELEWVFIGWGPQEPAAWGLKNVRSLGSIDHHLLPQYYQAADVLLLASRGEGFPLVIQEAMACGLPVLCSRDAVQGLPGIEAAVYSFSDATPDHVVLVLSRLLREQQGFPVRRLGALEYVRKHWQWEAWIGMYERIFLELLRATTGRECQAY